MEQHLRTSFMVHICLAWLIFILDLVQISIASPLSPGGPPRSLAQPLNLVNSNSTSRYLLSRHIKHPRGLTGVLQVEIRERMARRTLLRDHKNPPTPRSLLSLLHKSRRRAWQRSPKFMVLTRGLGSNGASRSGARGEHSHTGRYQHAQS